MPNTLAHMGIQALVTRGLISRADPGWIWLGCLLPDLPWILQRVVKALPIAIDAIDLRLYAVVQSSLLLCLLAAAAVAMLAARPLRCFAIVGLGCLLHLLLDATQTKWANGAVLFAPVDWRLLNFGLYWPESWPSHVLSLLGLVYVIWAALRLGSGALRLAPLPGWRWGAAAVLVLAYAVAPLALMPAAEKADLHYIGTLRDVAARPGQEVGFDRARLRQGPEGDRGLAIWTGETLALTGAPIPASAQIVSVQGRFTAPDTLEVAMFHTHPARQRDLVTVLGLAFIALWWGWALLAGLRRTKTPA